MSDNVNDNKNEQMSLIITNIAQMIYALNIFTKVNDGTQKSAWN